MSSEDKYAMCVRCNQPFERREELRQEHGHIYCLGEDQKVRRRHQYDF